MQLVVEVTSTDAGLRGEVRLPGREPAPFAGWLEFLALIERAAHEDAPTRGAPAVGPDSASGPSPRRARKEERG